VFGFVANRLNVTITGIETAQGGRYVPAFGEVAISLLVVALVFAAFRLGVHWLEVLPRAGGAALPDGRHAGSSRGA
jgi:hypothetical protein